MKQQAFDPQEAAVLLLAKLCGVSSQTIIEAFDGKDNYRVFKQPKRTGGFRIIAEPPEMLKLVQRRLLAWMYRIQKRTRYYYDDSLGGSEREDLFYKDVLRHRLDNRIHGSVPWRSVYTASRVHKETHAPFVIKMDLKSAFPSVTSVMVYQTLYSICVTECNAIYETYKERCRKYAKNDFPKRGAAFKPIPVLKGIYPKYPLFPSSVCWEFRDLIRDAVQNSKELRDTHVLEVIENFVQYVVQLVTLDECLPQGTPTSGFILNLVVSETRLLDVVANHDGWCPYRNDYTPQGKGRVSIYVDDIIVSTMIKPTKESLNRLLEKILKETGFRLHPGKMHIFDVRNQSAPILGVRLAQARIPPSEIDERYALYGRYRPRGADRRIRLRKFWFIKHITLTKKKQKQYRAFLYYCCTHAVTDQELAKAHGYLGHLVGLYGWPVPHMPATLQGPVALFRETYPKKQRLRSEDV